MSLSLNFVNNIHTCIMYVLTLMSTTSCTILESLVVQKSSKQITYFIKSLMYCNLWSFCIMGSLSTKKISCRQLTKLYPSYKINYKHKFHKTWYVWLQIKYSIVTYTYIFIHQKYIYIFSGNS